MAGNYETENLSNGDQDITIADRVIYEQQLPTNVAVSQSMQNESNIERPMEIPAAKVCIHFMLFTQYQFYRYTHKL